MSFKTKFFSIITLSVAIVAFSTFASAQETTTASPDTIQKHEKRERQAYDKRGEHGMRGGKHGGMMRGLHGLDLTDVQKEQFRALHQANRPNDAIREEARTLVQAKRDGTITAEQTERLKALKMQAREKGQAIHQQVLAILTPEQRQQMETRKEEMRKKMEERRQLRQQNKPATEKPTDN